MGPSMAQTTWGNSKTSLGVTGSQCVCLKPGLRKRKGRSGPKHSLPCSGTKRRIDGSLTEWAPGWSWPGEWVRRKEVGGPAEGSHGPE